jgi:uncharacterized protein (TIGR01777 family)
MGIVHSSVVDSPIDEVFAWHERPGAFTRLSPPWQTGRVLSESRSLRDGEAVLALPGGLTVVSHHDPSGYRPPNRFVDEIGTDGLASVPAGLVVPWRHTHEFESVGSATRVSDWVWTPVGSHLLRPMFLYRHRQLAEDLAAHRWAAGVGGGGPLTVAVTGASGLVGSALCASLTTGGHRVIRLVRHPVSGAGRDQREWNPSRPDPGLLEGVDAVVHLAGSSIAGRFTPAHERSVRDSRIEPTRLLAELAARGESGPRVFVSASAIGFYGADRGDELLTENSAGGAGFLADVVADWEAASLPASEAGLRVVSVRTGIVQAARGGTLRLFRPLFSAGLGGPIASGRQWLSWIDIDDLVGIYHRALFDAQLSGAVNAVSPHPVRNSEYARTLAHVLGRPALFAVPRVGPRLILGAEGSRELVEASQRVDPAALRTSGYPFRRDRLEDSLRHQLGRLRH